MINVYYIDAAIWIDLFEDRKGYNNEPLGEFALIFLTLIKTRNERIVITDFLVEELKRGYTLEELDVLINPFKHLIIKITVKPGQKKEAIEISKQRKLPKGDALHAIVARDYCLILITRDRHFKLLMDIAEYYKPEQLI